MTNNSAIQIPSTVETSTPSRIHNYVDGKFEEPSHTQDINDYLPVTTPHTGATIAHVYISKKQDVDRAVKAAQGAFEKWGSLTTKARCLYLIKLHSIVNSHMDELVDIIVREHGKNAVEAKAEVEKGLETMEWAIGLPGSSCYMGRYLEVSRGVSCRDVREPLGVVASIVPFNFPIVSMRSIICPQLTLSKMVPFWTIPIAIATGNTMLIKPSEKVPLTLARIVDYIKEAGIPDGVVNIVNGTVETVNALCDHRDIKALSFVGSSKVAQIVTERCNKVNKRVLALGGAKNHLVAAPDCNIAVSSSDIVNSFTGCAGERCMAASVLLTIGENKPLIDAIITKAKAIKHGSEAGCLGPVIDAPALSKIKSYIDEAETGGAEILLDGRSWISDVSISTEHSTFIGPTVILHKNKTDKAMVDEIFGPVLSVYVAKDNEEAIAIENSSKYGNAACIYTTAGLTAEWFTKRFSTGMVGVNVGIPVPREPFSFGGVGDSKFGSPFDITGEGAVELFTVKKKITTRWVESPSDFFSGGVK